MGNANALPDRNEVGHHTFPRTAGSPAFKSEVDMRKFLSLAVVAGALAVSACNTVEGVGRDVSSAGDAVAGAAKDSK